MFFEGIVGEIVRIVWVLGSIYMITGILGLLRITYNGSMEAIYRKNQGEVVPEWIYQSIPRVDRFLYHYTTLAMVVMIIPLAFSLFLFEALPKVA